MLPFALLITFGSTLALAEARAISPLAGGPWLPDIAGLMVDPATTPPPPAIGSRRTRSFLMEANFRGRYLFVPDSILDTVLFNEGDTSGHPARPSIQAWSSGVEYVIKKNNTNGIFYVEYLGFLIDDGYWDDREDPAKDTDGSYLVSQGLGFVTLGANYAYELHTNEKWLSFLFGTGLGLSIVTGEMIEWKPGPNATGDTSCSKGGGELGDPSNATALERYLAGCGDDGPIAIPPVLPMVDINIGARFNFSDRANLRVELGLHDLIYFGLASGVVF